MEATRAERRGLASEEEAEAGAGVAVVAVVFVAVVFSISAAMARTLDLPKRCVAHWDMWWHAYGT